MKHITADKLWPPPDDWTEVIVLWTEVLESPYYPITTILNWLDSAPGGEYHIHGYESTQGFSFRFKNPEDAVYFRLKWL
jgi:hypothetical protein